MKSKIIIFITFLTFSISICLFINYHAESKDALLAQELTPKQKELINKCYLEISKYIPKLFNYYVPMTTYNNDNKSCVGYVIADLHHIQGKSTKPVCIAFVDSLGCLFSIEDIKGKYLYKSSDNKIKQK
jgi:hypothetical protein